MFDEDNEKRFPRITLPQFLSGIFRLFAPVTRWLTYRSLMDVPPALISREWLSRFLVRKSPPCSAPE